MRDLYSTDLDGAAHEARMEADFVRDTEYDPCDDYPEVAGCPACDGPAMLLGTLGQREHFRCRDCGMDWSRREIEVAIDQDAEAQYE